MGSSQGKPIKRQFKNGTVVKNLREKYYGCIKDITRRPKLLEGHKDAEFLYVIEEGYVKHDRNGHVDTAWILKPINLKFAAECDLQPVTDTELLIRLSSSEKKKWKNPETILHKYGYFTGEGSTISGRRTAIQECIQKEGFRETVHILSQLIWLYNARGDREKYQKGSIPRCIFDLIWLSEKYSDHKELFEKHFRELREQGLLE